MAAKKMRYSALVGCGNISLLHVQALIELPDLELAGLVDPLESATGRTARIWTDMRSSRPECFASLDDLLKVQTPDVVHICTPHYTHVPLAIKALRSGCSVLLEKPPAISLSGLHQLENVQLETGRKVGVCFQNRFNPASLAAWRFLRSGVLGQVLGARAIVTWSRNRDYYAQNNWRGSWDQEGGGVLINQAIHELDLLFWLAGHPRQVAGQWSNQHLQDYIEVEDTAAATFQLVNGASAVFYASNAYCRDARPFLEICCEHHTLRLKGESLIISDHNDQPLDKDRQNSFLERATQILKQKSQLNPDDMMWREIADRQDTFQADFAASREKGKNCWGVSHTRLIHSFYASLGNDESGIDFPLTGNEASIALRAVQAIYESHSKNKAIQL